MRIKTLSLGLLLALAAGCQNKVSEQNQELYQQTHELQAQLDDARAKLAAAPDPNAVASLQAQLNAKNQQIAELEAAAGFKPAPGPQPGLEGVDTTYDPAAGTVTATIPGDVLFAPGKAELKESSKASLTKIVNAIQKQYAGKSLFVDGHTDADPITKTKDQWDDNWDLSYARAKAVTAYLINNGIDSKLVTVRAFGENQPKATKAASRRVEIVVVVR
jgi:flagellar motor protein MotB